MKSGRLGAKSPLSHCMYQMNCFFSSNHEKGKGVVGAKVTEGDAPYLVTLSQSPCQQL